MPGEWDDVLSALGLETSPSEAAGEATAVPSALQTQVAGFPARGANMLVGALGPLGEAGMTLGEMLRTRQFDSRMLPQIAGGVLLGTAAPGGLETGAVKDLSEAAIEKALTANPGASIFDLAGTHVGGPSSSFTRSVPRIDFENIPRTGYPMTPLAARVLGRSENLAHGTSVAVPRWSVPEGNVPDVHSPSNQVGSYGDALALPDDEIGVHFGNPKQSGIFAQAPDSNARTYPVVVATNNPLRMRDLGSWHLDRIVSELHRLNNNGGPYDGRFPYDELGSLETIGDARKYIASKGYDSIVYRNSEEDPGHDSYIKFIPSPVAPDYVSGVRSPFAQFDPQKLSWPELAAGLAGAGAIPALAHEEGQQE